jgi:hypothetical protein
MTSLVRRDFAALVLGNVEQGDFRIRNDRAGGVENGPSQAATLRKLRPRTEGKHQQEESPTEHN